jgi:ketosteroid isomerase-like protein
VDAEHAEVWSAVTAIYDAFLAGDRAAIDAGISPDATIWDAFHEPLLRGRGELDALRDARPADGPPPSDLVASDPVIDVHGDTAVVRHLLTVTYADAPEQRVRNTSVWRRLDGRWLCVHNHEDLLP